MESRRQEHAVQGLMESLELTVLHPSEALVSSSTRLEESTTETSPRARDFSPTSVVLDPLSCPDKNGGRSPPGNKSNHAADRRDVVVVPRVVMGEEGAEITLANKQRQRPPLVDKTNVTPPMVATPPHRHGGHRLSHMNSLLDADITPSPEISSSPDDIENMEEQHRPSLGAQILCGSGGSGCLSSDDEDDTCALVNVPQASVERTITLLLSDAAGLGGWCHAWQAWFFFGVEHGESHEDHTHETKEDMKRVLRNRAYDLNSKSRRIKALKDDLNPFDVHPTSTIQLSTPTPLSKTRSFSGYETKSFLEKTSIPPSSSDADISMSVVSLGSAVLESVSGCGHANADSPAVIGSKDLDDLCYDSDPEDMTRRQPRHGVLGDDKIATFISFRQLKNTLGDASRKSDLVVPRRLEFAFNDDMHAKDMVQEFMNEKFMLVWHRSVKPDTMTNGNSQGMIVWIERGQQVNSGLLQPKLVWRPAKDHEAEVLGRGLSTPCLESLELLDISRILEVNRINRKLYPFAKRKSCFLIETLDRKMLCEASSECERDHIVNGLKLTVARFASKVIVQDPDVLDEFFTSFLVPGEAPRWTRESNTLNSLL